METIKDIVDEMREFADADSQSIGRDLLRRRIQHFADRITKAITNCSPFMMREALKEIRATLSVYAMSSLANQEVKDYFEKVIEQALSAPPRNCDLYPHDEALRIWSSLPESKENGCFDEWLYAEAKEDVK